MSISFFSFFMYAYNVKLFIASMTEKLPTHLPNQFN